MKIENIRHVQNKPFFYGSFMQQDALPKIHRRIEQTLASIHQQTHTFFAHSCLRVTAEIKP